MERSRRSVLLSVPPLWLIGVCLFLPTVRSCERLESPAQLIKGSPLLFGGMLSPYLFAELLAVLAIVALARGRLTLLTQRLTLAAVVLSGASACVLTVTNLFVPRLDEQAWGLFACGCLAAGFATLWRSRADEPWLRQARRLAAFTVFTLPLATLLARIGIEDGLHKLGYGAWLFFAAVIALCVVHTRLVVRSSPA